MPIATQSPGTERALHPFAAVVRYLKRRGILTDARVAAATGIDDLISDVYGFLRSGTIELFGGGDSSPELQAVRRFEQHIRHMQKLGLLTDALVAALTTVLGVSAATDLLFLMTGILSDTTLDTTTQNSMGFEMNYAYATTR